jgi:flagellar hook-basal body complex protein FliE
VGAPSANPSAGFGDVLDTFVSDVNGKMNSAATDQSKLLSGDSTSLHQAMISMQEANVAFSLMVEVRNKLVDGYQELMRMQI